MNFVILLLLLKFTVELQCMEATPEEIKRLTPIKGQMQIKLEIKTIFKKVFNGSI